MKNDNIHRFFPLFWLQILNLPALLQTKNTRIGPFPWKRSVLRNPDRERTNQSTGICLRLGLPYNNIKYSASKYFDSTTIGTWRFMVPERDSGVDFLFWTMDYGLEFYKTFRCIGITRFSIFCHFTAQRCKTSPSKQPY